MNYMEHYDITSTSNSRIKEVIALQEKSKLRSKQGLAVIEGKREVSLACMGHMELTSIFYQPELISKDELTQIIGYQKAKTYQVSPEVYQKMAHRSSTEGVIALGKQKNHHITHMPPLGKNPLVLVAEGIEKPGNIGAMLRTADAAGIDAVLLPDMPTDLYNPNTIRASLGCVFTLPIATGSSQEIIDYLLTNHVGIYSATLQASIPYSQWVATGPTAIVVGSEDRGVSELFRKNSTQNILIPMQGAIDSMNVSVAAAILVFEAKRQRNLVSLK
ncbi:MAG: hypothetical protein RL501_708 [Bacteroidota bacterium]